jgi:riboflavin synthase
VFTGIIKRVGHVVRAERAATLLRLRMAIGDFAAKVAVGGSVAVDGVCLTATHVSAEDVSFDVGEETLRLTTLGEFRVGRRINIELPLAASEPIGGHIVQGHVDGVGTISNIIAHSSGRMMEISVPAALASGMALKGSVAVDGVSLTIAALREADFQVFLIPQTLAVTTLGEKRVGNRVNIETDILGKYVGRISGRQAGGITPEMLEKHGFC